ncbi:MAG TPA: cytochrome c, partial [Verrucomicrobiae bacterium]
VDTGATYGVPHSEGIARNKEERIQLGKRLFTMMCATCHQAAGQGVASKYPPLAVSDFLNRDKNEAIRVLLHGRQGEISVNGITYNNTMPSFPLSDEDIANALTYTYNSFGNSGKDVTPEEVKALRAEKYIPSTSATNQPSQFE